MKQTISLAQCVKLIVVGLAFILAGLWGGSWMVHSLPEWTWLATVFSSFIVGGLGVAMLANASMNYFDDEG